MRSRICAEWSNRILLMALIGITYLTLFPFHFETTIHHAYRKSPFLLGLSNKPPSPMDFLLNVLLFIPFGFGIGAQLCKRGWSRSAALGIALCAGTVTSYLVELMQLYSPLRDSGWDDVFSNSLGSVVGYAFFAACGYGVLEELSKLSNAVENWLSARKIAAALLIYFAIAFGVSAYLTRDTRLTNWETGSLLFVGNDAGEDSPWEGRIFKLELWSRAIPESLFRSVPPRNPDTYLSGMLASYDFAAPPYVDRRSFLPALIGDHAASKWTSSGALELDGKSWLSSKVPVDNLTREIQKTNQFTVRVICAPTKTNVEGRIFSLSKSAEEINLHLRQEGSKLVLWFRNPLSSSRSVLAWYIPHVFEAGQTRDIVATYDGSDALIYVDGKKAGIYRLGPGVSFVHRFFSVQTNSLQGYIFLYQTLIFLPAGVLVGMATRKWRGLTDAGKAWIALSVLVPPILLEVLLVQLGGRRMWPENIVLSMLLIIAGAALVNADLASHTQRPYEPAERSRLKLL